MQFFVAVGSTWRLDDERILTGTKEFTCLLGIGQRMKAWSLHRSVNIYTIQFNSIQLYFITTYHYKLNSGLLTCKSKNGLRM